MSFSLSNKIVSNLNFIREGLFKKNSLPNLLIILLPLFLITGPFLSDLAVIITSLYFLFSVKKDEIKKYFKNFLFIYLAFFCLYLILNGFFVNSNLDTIRISTTYIRHIIFILAIWYFLDKNNWLIFFIFFSFLFCFWILIIDGYFQLIFGQNIIGMKLIGSRVSSFFGDELILGSYLSRFFPIFFGISTLIIDKFKQKRITFFLALTFILIEVLIFHSGERTSFFYLNLSAIFMIIFLKNHKKLRLFAIIASLLLITIFTFIDNTAKKRMIDRTINQGGISLNDKSFQYIFSKQHSHHYLSALKMFKDDILFGKGIKNFKNFCSDEKYNISELSCSTHPHNTYIQLLSETGLVGFLFVFFGFSYICLILIKHFRNSLKKRYIFNDLEICVLCSIFTNLWPFIPTGNFFNNWLCIVYSLPVGIFLWSREKSKINNKI